ncbi:MAG: extracellular solute-binding protein [Clostridia bacterium]|nr:extracellular solute-binding protein [Clostridia bacterium]
MLHRRIALLLGILAAVQLPVSCREAEQIEPPRDTGINISDTVTEPPVFKEKDLGGENFTFITYNDIASSYYDAYIVADSSAGEAISEAVTRRNDEAKSMFNINVASNEVYSPKNEAISRIQAGQCDFDVIYESGTELSSLALDGLLTNYADLTSVDLNRSYWVPSTKEDLTIGGKMYIATNYVTMNSISYADMIYFNESMYKALGYTESLYDTVKNGTWTIDKYVDLAVSAVSDLNEDDTMTANDRFGIWGDSSGCLTSLVQFSGGKNTHENGDGSYQLDVYNEKAVSIYTKYVEKLNQGKIFLTYDDVWAEQPNLTDFATRAEGARFLGFGEGHVLFMPGNLGIMHEFGNMKDDFGVLPNPRYDTKQESLQHFINSEAPMLAIPQAADDVGTAGLILEYMAYRSEKHLLPEYIANIAGEGKSPDPNDEFMIDIIRSTVRYEWTEVYNLDVTNTIMNKMMVSGSFKSVYNRLISKAKAEINGCVDTLAFIGLK